MWPNEVKMPSINKCRERWSCRVRKKNGSSIRKTFNTKKEALAWGAQKELEIEQGQLSKIETVSFAGACRLYLKLFTPHKAPSTQNYENITLGKICREAWANKPLHDLSASDLLLWREQRGKKASQNTIRREVSAIRVVAYAAEKMGINLDLKIFMLINKPKVVPRIPRRINEDDMLKLFAAADDGASRNDYLKHLIRLAVETGMRRGELLDIEWRDVDLSRGFIIIPATKTKTSRQRDIPLTSKAQWVVEALWNKRLDEPRLFNVSGNAVRIAFARLRNRAELPHIHFHDFRHEAISRFYDMGLTTPEVMAISGHRSVEMVERYSHASTANLVAKLQKVGM